MSFNLLIPQNVACTSLDIHGLLGYKVRLKKEFKTNSREQIENVDLHNLKTRIYFLQVIMEQEIIYTNKI